ncbi:P-loop containing nucleoside triphosphate hydrolase protein [Aspergillus keveii]|uniref:P-loop containing nucleoside triphosphate hydrolase protein n=1 Tax=Aspergillus keveii TaxID=714993 RepID=A0ABR4FZ31_9EURO
MAQRDLATGDWVASEPVAPAQDWYIPTATGRSAEDIVNVWRSEDESLAVERLKRLFKYISIRRSKTILDLPRKTDLVRYLSFDSDELAAYKALEDPIATMIDENLRSDNQRANHYMKALAKINLLRRFCNFGSSLQGFEFSNSCAGSAARSEEIYERLPTGLGAPVSFAVVVFSSWTTTFDMVQSMFDASEISYVRIDGKVSQKDRASALSRFQTDPLIQVMLLSIYCGAEGLNITAASLVYLMEPQWNPNIESQALARVHRLGQTREVTTTTFIMKDSIESHVIKVQDRKKHLGDLLLSQNRGGAEVNRGRLQHLRSLVN